MLLHRKKAKLNEYLRYYRASNASPPKWAKHNEYQRNYRKSNASRQKKAKLDEYQRNYRASNASLKFLVIKFHDKVSPGPMYVCNCCDQLWYKHSVLHADKLWHSNPEIDKYLCNKKSVDNIIYFFSILLYYNSSTPAKTHAVLDCLFLYCAFSCSAAPSVPLAIGGPASDTAGTMQILPLIDPVNKIDYEVPMRLFIHFYRVFT